MNDHGGTWGHESMNELPIESDECEVDDYDFRMAMVTKPVTLSNTCVTLFVGRLSSYQRLVLFSEGPLSQVPIARARILLPWGGGGGGGGDSPHGPSP